MSKTWSRRPHRYCVIGKGELWGEVLSTHVSLMRSLRTMSEVHRTYRDKIICRMDVEDLGLLDAKPGHLVDWQRCLHGAFITMDDL